MLLDPASPSQLQACLQIRLRPADQTDIPEILRFERIPEFHTMVGCWPEKDHRRALGDQDVRYFMLMPGHDAAVGFAIMRGILSPHRSVELKRFVIGTPGRGLGQQALQALARHVFRELGAHRFWLDAFTTNARALHVYRKAGFKEEGVLREAIYRDGAFHSLLLLSLLNREYFSAEAP